ncbi:hypothetical protein EPUS_07985 [Endocarpon pusillum Z07020]|uniref:Ribosome-associated complex subunit SSZ1 n=1 Tax=Endocarpon pusillum (strain Z07020 / HMAS-L-300199) TaxID=1263415 RepID=U1I0R1_ENDPU|nr:uncharacterized protein EPUS_07985 [Endocarpon pusillum Z07020]ERF76805.1 hypothetical protein EPUS_07985 [Endocarpon pusillum Z07020]
MSEEVDGASSTEGVEQYAIGISFGNSNSSIAHLSADGKAEVIANEEGDRLIPSFLSYVDGEEFHGTQAKAQLVRNSRNTIGYFRDYLGKDFKSIDPTPCHGSAHPQENASTVAFSIQDTESETPNTVSVSEITTRHLRRLKQSASDFSGKAVTSAVIAIPTDASEAQTEALADAAENAQLNVLQFISEPIAALMAYDSRGDHKDKLVVVADLGGNRSDIAVVASRGGMYSILAAAHDYELGGVKLDQVLVDHFAKEFIKKHKIDPRDNERSLAKLKLEAEAVKKALSLSASATLSVESLAEGFDFRSTVNRTRYELLAGKVFQSFTRLIEEAVKKADLDLLDIEEVILSGGTAHTPKIAQNLKSLFSEHTTVFAPSTSPTAINPAFLAATGAAIQASLIQEFEKEDIEQSTHPMVTVTPHIPNAIGIEIEAQEGTSSFEVVIPQDSAVPVRKTKVMQSLSDGEMVLRVCEGQRKIKTTKPEPRSKAETNGEEDSDEDSDVEDEEDVRERIWEAIKPLGEITARVKKGLKVEVTVNVGADLSISITARELGAKTGVRGNIEKPEVTENGQA